MLSVNPVRKKKELERGKKGHKRGEDKERDRNKKKNSNVNAIFRNLI